MESAKTLIVACCSGDSADKLGVNTHDDNRPILGKQTLKSITLIRNHNDLNIKHGMNSLTVLHPTCLRCLGASGSEVTGAVKN